MKIKNKKILFVSLIMFLIIVFLIIGLTQKTIIKKKPICDTEVSDILTKEELIFFTNKYYQDPKPELVVPAINTIRGENIYYWPMAVFFSEIFRQNDDKVEKWIMQDLCGLRGLYSIRKQEDLLLWDVLVTALYWAETNESKRVLDMIREQANEDQIQYIDVDLKWSDSIDLKTIKVDSSEVLDTLWAGFFATGDKIYIERIISALPLRYDESIEVGAIGYSAKGFLESNSKNHPKIIEICNQDYLCKKILFASNEDITNPYLREVVIEEGDKEYKKRVGGMIIYAN
jgi:hypothetical protein